MDVLTLAGLAIGLGGLVLGMMLDGGSILALLQAPAALVVFGGTLGAILVESPMPVFLRALKMLAWMVSPPPSDARGLMENLLAWSKEARRDGLLALEKYVEEQEDHIVAEGLKMVVDGFPAQKLRTILETMAHTREQKELHAARMFSSAGGYSPTIGIIGAVMGLITVLAHLDDPTKLGGGIATAFVATIYGVGAANLLWLPIGAKLRTVIGWRARRTEMVIDGFVGIVSGENSRGMELRMKGFLEDLDAMRESPETSVEESPAPPELEGASRPV